MSAELEAVAADATADVAGTVVSLVTDNGEFTVTVPPPGKWRTRANRALREGNFDVWAETVLSEKDVETWAAADPTNDDMEEFFRAWKELSGEDQGKSSASRRSSRSTARR